jgi:hypothetical protein
VAKPRRRSDGGLAVTKPPAHSAQLETPISMRVSSSGAITMASWPVAISAQRHPYCALTQLREACSAA